MDVAVQHAHRSEAPQHRGGLLGIASPPAPVGVEGPERDVSEDHDGRGVSPRGEVGLEPGQLIGAQLAHAARFELLDVDQADEVDALMVEAEPAVAGRALAVAIEEGLAVPVVQHVVLARHVEGLQPRLAQDLIGVVELVVPRQLADVAGVDDEVGRLRQRPDLGDGLAVGDPGVRIGRLGEADVAVGHLHEVEAGALRRLRQRLVQADRRQHPAADAPHRSRARPSQAAQDIPAVGPIPIFGHGVLLLRSPRSRLRERRIYSRPAGNS